MSVHTQMLAIDLSELVLSTQLVVMFGQSVMVILVWKIQGWRTP